MNFLKIEKRVEEISVSIIRIDGQGIIKKTKRKKKYIKKCEDFKYNFQPEHFYIFLIFGRNCSLDTRISSWKTIRSRTTFTNTHWPYPAVKNFSSMEKIIVSNFAAFIFNKGWNRFCEHPLEMISRIFFVC